MIIVKDNRAKNILLTRLAGCMVILRRKILRKLYNGQGKVYLFHSLTTLTAPKQKFVISLEVDIRVCF